MDTAAVTTQSSKSPDSPGGSFQSTSHDYVEAQSKSERVAPPPIKIPDGRRNSQGQIIPSPVETWKPNFSRRMSWNREDLKREQVINDLGKRKDEGWGTGFTEAHQGASDVTEDDE